ncbi:MAG: PAS domain S-box protein [Actinobacteria bacterium]|nr:PAS domain S-box protein [Actinomycetota bacterium]
MTDEIKERSEEKSSRERPLLSQEDILEKILEISPIGIIIQDEEGRDVMANSRAEEILGIDRGEITSRTYRADDWDPHDREGNPRRDEDTVAVKVRNTGRPVFGEEVMIPRPDGTHVILSVNATPITREDGSYGGLVYSFEDITQRVNGEKELAQSREHLQELVAVKTAELEEANRRLSSEIEERKMKEKELLITTEQLRKLSQRIETVREEEKARFAARIHDTFEQSLAILKMRIKDLERSLSDEKRQGGELEPIYKTLNYFLDEIQVVSEELRPRILSDAGLMAAIEWQMKDVQKNTGIDTSFHSNIDGLVITEVLSTFIYRVFQEAVSNAVKHAEAFHVETDLLIEEGALTLRIIDDGRGMSREEQTDPESLGLLWMKERAKHFGGNIEIMSREDRGTEITLRVPISSV